MNNENLRITPLGFHLAVQITKFARKSGKDIDWLPDFSNALQGYDKIEHENDLIGKVHDFLYALEVGDFTIVVSNNETNSYEEYADIKSGERVLTYALYKLEVDQAVIDDDLQPYLERYASTYPDKA